MIGRLKKNNQKTTTTKCGHCWSCSAFGKARFLEHKFRNLELEILWSRNEKENFYLTLLLRKEAHVSVLIVVKKLGQGYLFYDRLSWYYHSLWVLTFSASAFISNFFWDNDFTESRCKLFSNFPCFIFKPYTILCFILITFPMGSLVLKRHY